MNESSSPRSPNCYIYRPLAPGLIRVLELEAGHPSDPIIGRLVPQAINGEAYEAVSYVWGDAQNRRDVDINDTTFSITANLYGALTAFRHRKQVRRLWADALCINQADLSERTAQLELMGLTFAGARRVLAWLGWEEGEEGRRLAQAAIRFIHSFMEDPEAGLRDARILLLHHDITVTGPAARLDILSEDDHHQFEEQARSWVAVKAFFEMKYFHRAWIVQELGLAREAIMYTALRPVDSNNTSAIDLDLIDWPLVGRFAKFLDYSGASLVTHLGLLSWVAHHILMVWETKQDGTPECDFLTAMHWVRILGVTDARDRVYSLLGHPKAVMGGHLVIKPNYTVTRGVVYTQLAANFIRKTKNLYAVNLVDHEDDPCTETRDWDPQDDSRMPSWVPDWHSINRTTPQDYPVPAAAVEDADIQIDGEVDGVEGTPLPHLLVRGWVVDEISTVSHRMETTDFPITHLAREQAKDNPFWLDCVWEVVFPANASPDRDGLSVLEALSLALPLGTKEEGKPVSTAGHQQTLVEHRRSFAAYVLEYHKLRSEAGSIDGNLPARSLYDSLPVEAQAELRRRAEGATGGDFVECMTWSSMCRVVYRTASGLVGMGSRVTRPGDLVCRVRGSLVLTTLRRTENYRVGQGTKTSIGTDDAAPMTCVFIGPTVVPARMKKGVVDGGEFSEKAARFRIV
ncbi:heterokaryon incompatibility protein-domain-containing protein [Lasiosphaeria hispida]|uniref:Heterokaryon incompatibility protein-domain-containing protein n=1 Tax=Lasiosphaeria hispida TaxID=260671 RepID=A0AAJ0HA13_9PEZI|nr:heterokaryon incompatibility protein-domain-containing protein [Lasiosphaeria hispida]